MKTFAIPSGIGEGFFDEIMRDSMRNRSLPEQIL